jgi:hypothetical protein
MVHSTYPSVLDFSSKVFRRVLEVSRRVLVASNWATTPSHSLTKSSSSAERVLFPFSFICCRILMSACQQSIHYVGITCRRKTKLLVKETLKKVSFNFLGYRVEPDGTPETHSIVEEM